MSFKHIGIIVKPESEDVRVMLPRVIDYLENRSCTLVLDETVNLTPDIDIQGLNIVSREELSNSCDLAISLGGDGTILNAARSLANKDIPLLGINMGRLGFLADVSPDEFEKVLDDVFAGHYQSDERFLLHAEVQRDGETIFESEALNDVVLHVRDVVRMIEFETWVDGQFVNEQGADGLIVTTPTGSTAYAVSGGGPILHAGLDAIALVPVCPHTLSSRPLVISADSEVSVTLGNTRHANAQVTCDGQYSVDIVQGDRLLVRRKSHTVLLLHPQNHSYYEILRAKLRWSEHLT